MSLFRKLGRQVGQFTEGAKTAAEEYADHECADCGARFDGAPDTCPECGSENVAARERPD